jgi:hypothetical protein
VQEFDKLNLRIVANTEVMEMEVGSSLLQEIRKGQLEDEKIQEIKHNIKEEKSHGFSEDDECVLWYRGKICVPNVKELKDKILHEAHESAYSINPRGNKMNDDLKATYWLYGMKRDVVEYIAPLWQHSDSQGWASMTCWIVGTLASTWVNVGIVCYGFCQGIA